MKLVIAGVLCLCLAGRLDAQSDPSTLPLLSIDDLEYVGAFRLPASTYGGSSLNYSEGPIAFNPSNNSILIVGHSHHQQIAEFVVPTLVKSDTLANLSMAAAPLQDFSSSVLSRVSNPQSINRIGGLAVVNSMAGPRLLVNGYEYYDAPGDNNHTTLVVDDPDSIATAAVGGYYTFSGGAGHTSGWMSPIPPEWRDTLGGTYISGQSSGIPIISRTSVGPSAFVFDPADILDSAAVPTPIPTTKLLDFSLANPLHTDLSNSSGNNDIWTHLSRATYGIIIPGSRTYMTFGYSGGHGAGGVCYKCTQSNGNLCGGYCAPDPSDYYQFAWLWSMNDLVAVMNGTMESYDVRPYAYGPFATPFENGTHEIGGGTYDPVTGNIYLTIQRADRAQGTYSNPPVVVVFKVSLPVQTGLSVMLEGPYEPASDSMLATANDSLPAGQPFSDAQFDGTALDHDGPEVAVTMPPDVVDWVLVQLRSGNPASPPMNIVATRAALLKSDGSIVDLDGAGPVAFTGVANGDYYVVVQHRNHLAVMSSATVALSSAPTYHDFASTGSQAYGVGSMTELEAGVWGLFGGDANSDGQVTAQDFNSWLVTTKAGGLGYDRADFNLDLQVTTSDFNLWLKNTKIAASTRIPTIGE